MFHWLVHVSNPHDSERFGTRAEARARLREIRQLDPEGYAQGHYVVLQGAPPGAPPEPVESDEQRLRGLPLVGGHRSSAILGSQPELAVIRLERRRTRHRPDEPTPTGIVSAHYGRKGGGANINRAAREAGRFFNGR